MMNIVKRVFAGIALAVPVIYPGLANALTLEDAVRLAIESNPEIGQAIANREAREFELRQAVGLYLPNVDLESSIGVQSLSNLSRRGAGIEDDDLYPRQVEVVVSYDLLDNGFRRSEANRQAARIDSASFRVLERTELVGLEIARLYFEILLQARIVDFSRRNLSFHQATLRDVGEVIKNNGPLTEADRQQATERLAAAKASVTQALESLEEAKIGFLKVVGVPFKSASVPRRVGGKLPRSLSRAIEIARQNNPRVRSAEADVDAAAALVKQAAGALGPRLTLEGRATSGDEIGGDDSYTTDLQGRLVLRWNIYDGGIRSARVQEQIRLEGEALSIRQQAGRDVEEAARISWDRINKQNSLRVQYQSQLNASNQIVSSYKQQFTNGDRSLLDVLDSQNGRFSAQVLTETADFSVRFAEYRLMAATGTLLEFLGLSAPGQAEPYARELLNSPSSLEAEPRTRKPVSFGSPIDLTDFVN